MPSTYPLTLEMSQTYFGLGWVIWEDFRLGGAQFGHSPNRWGVGKNACPLFFSPVTVTCPLIPEHPKSH